MKTKTVLIVLAVLVAGYFAWQFFWKKNPSPAATIPVPIGKGVSVPVASTDSPLGRNALGAGLVAS
jgi:hypothetical protein